MDTSIKLKLDLGKLYKSNFERTEFAIELYKELYDLPIVQQEYDVTKELFEYCKKRNFFINILAFNKDKVFFKRSINEKLQWELPGGSIRSKGNESIEDAASRILQRDIPKIEMAELRPIAFLIKTYRYSGEDIVHYGLSVMGRIRSVKTDDIEKNEDIKGRFVLFNNDLEVNCLVQIEKKILTIGIQKLKDFDTLHLESIDREIDSTKTIDPFIMTFHNCFIRPLGRRYSSDIIKKQILNYLKKEYTVLDVACGDDDFLFKLASSCEMCVGNDVIWSQIKVIAEKGSTFHHNLFFTNHDACNLPFKKKFDLTLCKNLLHHMHDRTELENLFNSLRNVSKRILIVDPEDPHDTSLRAKIWNWYYRTLLKDQGERFYKMTLFKQLINKYFWNAIETKFERVKTIKGNYMFGYIELPETIKGASIKQETTIKTKAIIFDLDGLLVDTEPLFLKAIKSVLNSNGIEITDRDYIDSDLQNGSSLLEKLLNRGIIKDKNELMLTQENIYKEYFDLLKNDIKEMPYAIESINRVKPFFKLAIASSSKRQFIEYILDKLKIKNDFQLIISREDTLNLKPDPECYQMILKEFGLHSGECVVVEDSLRGANAAHRAGIKIIIIPNELTKNTNYDNAKVLNSLKELTPELLLQINN